jgi:hypothetical protein
MNIASFQVSGNTSVLAADVATGNTQIIIQPSGQTPNNFYVYNSSGEVVFVNITTSATANVVIPAGNQDGRGFPVSPFSPVTVTLGQQFNYNPGNIYVTAMTVTGPANLYVTPIV